MGGGNSTEAMADFVAAVRIDPDNPDIPPKGLQSWKKMFAHFT